MRERNFFFAASKVSLTTPEPVSRPSAMAAGSTRNTVHGVQADVPMYGRSGFPLLRQRILLS